jgi:hypothetical protein
MKNKFRYFVYPTNEWNDTGLEAFQLVRVKHGNNNLSKLIMDSVDKVYTGNPEVTIESEVVFDLVETLAICDTCNKVLPDDSKPCNNCGNSIDSLNYASCRPCTVKLVYKHPQTWWDKLLHRIRTVSAVFRLIELINIEEDRAFSFIIENKRIPHVIKFPESSSVSKLLTIVAKANPVV